MAAVVPDLELALVLGDLEFLLVVSNASLLAAVCVEMSENVNFSFDITF